MEPRYIGDGIYLSEWQDGYGLVITTGDHDEVKADNVVFLEPFLLPDLIKCMSEWLKEKEKK